MFNALSVVKFAVSGVVGIGTTKIVSQLIKNNIASPETLIDKVSIVAAAWVIGGVAAKTTKAYTNETIDDLAQNVTDLVTKFKTDAKLGRVDRGESTLEEEGLDPTQFEKNPVSGHWKKKVEEPAAS